MLPRKPYPVMRVPPPLDRHHRPATATGRRSRGTSRAASDSGESRQSGAHLPREETGSTDAGAPAPAPPVAAPSPPPAEAADGAPAGQPATGPGAPSQENVDQLTAMGFPEQECRAALAAAFNDVTRAAQYLMDPESMPQQPAVPAAATADAEDGGGNAGAGPVGRCAQNLLFSGGA